MLRHRDILQGLHFTWITDHKGLIHLYNQKILSGRQARWMEKLGEFDFGVQYVPGAQNVLTNSLSRLWSNESPGTVRAQGIYTYHDIVDNDSIETHDVSMPVLVGLEAACLVLEGVHLDLNGMSLHSEQRPSAQARGLDNVLVPGKLREQMGSGSNCRPRKEGEGAKKNVPKPKSNPKSNPKSKVKHTMVPKVETFEPASEQSNENVQEETKLAEAISPSSLIEHQEPLAQPPEEHENLPSNKGVTGLSSQYTRSVNWSPSRGLKKKYHINFFSPLISSKMHEKAIIDIRLRSCLECRLCNLLSIISVIQMMKG